MVKFKNAFLDYTPYAILDKKKNKQKIGIQLSGLVINLTTKMEDPYAYQAFSYLTNKQFV